MTDARAAAPSNKRLELGARSRDEILNAALRTMADFGYEGASISRIAAESGLPASSIYWHFDSKAGVLAAVMERGADRFFSAGDDASAAGLVPRDRFRHALQTASRAVTDNPEFLRLLFLLVLVGGPDDQVRQHVRDVVERGKQSLRTALEFTYAEHGSEVATQVADEVVDFAQSAFDGIFIGLQTHEELNHARLTDQLAEALLALGDAVAARLDAQNTS